MLRRLASGAAIVAVALALAGCTPPEPTESTTPPVTPTTSAPSEVQMLAETRASWDAYQVTMSELGADPSSATLEPIREVATPEFADFLLANLQDAADRRIHTEGIRETTRFLLESLAEAPRSITINACLDLSQERVVGDEGIEIAQPASPQSQTIEFIEAHEPGSYLVSGVTEYQGPSEEDPCTQ